MLLVVNIVTCPIGTDCGGSAPVVGVYRQPCLAEGVLPVLRTTVREYKCHFECHINCMHSHSYNNVACTMKTSEFMITQVNT